MFIVYLPILKVPVDLLGLIEQVEHLPQSKLKIHLPEVEYPPQILKIHEIQIVNSKSICRKWNIRRRN